MGCGVSKPTVTRVVIVGGGYGGAYLTYLLQNEGLGEITLIDPAEAMVHHMAISRCLVEPEFLKKAFIPYRDFVNNFVRETATEINRKKQIVVLKNGKKVRYDYLVIALDCNASFPRKLSDVAPGPSTSEAERLYKDFTEEIKKAPEIVLLGGNQFAVETAGEIRTDYPDKKVTILHSKGKLLGDSVPLELQSSLMEILDRKEVDVLLDDHVTNLESIKLNQFVAGQMVETKSGCKVPGDLVVTCGEESSMPHLIDTTFTELSQHQGGGKLSVDDYMRVLHCANVYAIGEVTNSGSDPFEEKEQAKVVLENLKHAITMEGSNIMFRQNKTPVMITIGRYGGIGYENGKLLDDDEVMERKSEDLFTEMMWKDLGLDYNL